MFRGGVGVLWGVCWLLSSSGARAERPKIDETLVLWEPGIETVRMSPPRLGVLDGVRYVLDPEGEPLRVDPSTRAIPTKGLLFSPLTEGPLGQPHEGMGIEGELTLLEGETSGAAVAIVASSYAIIIKDVYLWRKTRWARWSHSYAGNAQVVQFQLEPKGRVLALLGNVYGYELSMSDAGKAPRPRAGHAPCRTLLEAIGLSRAPDGTLFVVGTRCGTEGGALVEVWKPGAAASVLMNLEGEDPVQARSMAASGGPDQHELFVGGCLRQDFPFLATVTSEGWRVEAAPEVHGCIDSLALSHGSLWAVIEGRLWERPRGEPWRLVKTRAPWSDPSEVSEVRVIGAGASEELWVTLRTPPGPTRLPKGTRYALLHAYLSSLEAQGAPP